MQAQADPLGILATAHTVVELARQVAIRREGVLGLARQLAHRPPELLPWDRELHFFDGGVRTLNYLLLLDALNFSFWGDSSARWEVEFHGRTLSGYGALAGALTRAVAGGIPLWEASFLAQLDAATLADMLRGPGEVPLLAERLAIAQEVGSVLRDRWGGWFSNVVEAAEGSAVALVRRVLADFSSFRDEAAYRDHVVRFYKRAQILCADLHDSFGGESWGQFADLDRLTVFADYKLPQVLRELGVLEYRPALAARVDGCELLPPGSEEEVEIRAATVWACELLRRELAAGGCPLPAHRLDRYLWDLSQNFLMSQPHHRTRTIFY